MVKGWYRECTLGGVDVEPNQYGDQAKQAKLKVATCIINMYTLWIVSLVPVIISLTLLEMATKLCMPAQLMAAPLPHSLHPQHVVCQTEDTLYPTDLSDSTTIPHSRPIFRVSKKGVLPIGSKCYCWDVC